MTKRCVLGGCSNTNKGGFVMHKFPKDKKLASIWSKFVKRTRVWENASEHSVLCSAHFADNAYQPVSSVAKKLGYKAPLKPDAIPTISVPVKPEIQLHKKRDNSSMFKDVVTSTPKKKRTAVVKRERVQVI